MKVCGEVEGLRTSLARELHTTAPLFPIALGLILGILLDTAIPTSIIFWMIALVFSTVGLVLTVTRPAPRIGCLTIAALSAGAMLNAKVVGFLPASSIEHHATEWGQYVRVRGQVITPPKVQIPSEEWLGPMWRWMHAETRTSFALRIVEAQGESGWIPATGSVRVTIAGPILHLSPNERVEILGELFTVSPARHKNPGAMDWGRYLRRQGLVAKLVVDDPRNLRSLGLAQAGWIERIVDVVRTRSAAWLTDDLAAAPEEVSFLSAMVLGRQSQFDRKLNEIFSRSGCMHFVAVSGTNVAMLMGGVWLACRMLGLSRHRSAWFMLVAIILYALATEPRAPILRATVLGILVCLALRMRRIPSPLNWTSAAAIFLIVLNPLTIFDAGFQLSFVAVLAVCYLSAAIRRALRDAVMHLKNRGIWRGRPAQELNAHNLLVAPNAKLMRRGANRVLRAFLSAFVISLAAWIATLPIVATYFNQAQIWAPFSSAILFPLMSLVMILGGLKIGLTPIVPPVGAFVGSLLTSLDRVLLTIVEWISRLPGTEIYCRTPPWWLTIAYFGTLLLFVLRFRHIETLEPVLDPFFNKPRTTRAMMTSSKWLAASFFITFAMALGWQLDLGKPDRLIVTIFSVGTGSATLIELPGGGANLYDAGTNSSYDVGRATIAPLLRQRGIRHIDHAYVSHADMDHFSGLPGLMQEVPIQTLWLNPYFDRVRKERIAAAYFVDFVNRQSLREYTQLDQAVTSSMNFAGLNTMNIIATEPSKLPTKNLDLTRRKWNEGEVSFELLWPKPPTPRDISDNDSSLVMRISYAGHSILLTGDIEDFAQKALLASEDLRADVLVLPHHGAVRQSTEAFLDAVNAEYLIRSSAQPMSGTINGLKNIVGRRRLFNTADSGAIQIVMDQKGIQVRTMSDDTSEVHTANSHPQTR